VVLEVADSEPAALALKHEEADTNRRRAKARRMALSAASVMDYHNS